MSISNFFEKTLGANLSNARWSWGASNPVTHQLFLRVWDDELETVDGAERIVILKGKFGGKSSGYPERVRHIELLRNGADGYGVLCTAKDTSENVSRTIAKFDHETLLDFGGVVDDGNNVYAQVVGRVHVGDLGRLGRCHRSVGTLARGWSFAKIASTGDVEIIARPVCC